MLSRSEIEQQLKHTFQGIDSSEFPVPYHGKVRDCFAIGKRKILVTSDRLSAFDRILTTVPYKGQLINRMASYWFRVTRHIVRNHVLEEPHPNIFVVEALDIVPIEVVVRGYLTGSAWRDYSAGKDVSGVRLSPGKKKNEKFSTPLITPSTKAPDGKHDEPISGPQIISHGIVRKPLWDKICEVAVQLFEFGAAAAKERGLILVDTKYEFGLVPGTEELVLADEIHTQDSSRYWVANTYEEKFAKGEEPTMLSKEFVRTWLMERGYMGDGEAPVMDDQFRVSIAQRYMEVCEMLTGESFTAKVGPIDNEVREILRSYF